MLWPRLAPASVTCSQSERVILPTSSSSSARPHPRSAWPTRFSGSPRTTKQKNHCQTPKRNTSSDTILQKLLRYGLTLFCFLLVLLFGVFVVWFSLFGLWCHLSLVFGVWCFVGFPVGVCPMFAGLLPTFLLVLLYYDIEQHIV